MVNLLSGIVTFDPRSYRFKVCTMVGLRSVKYAGQF